MPEKKVKEWSIKTRWGKIAMVSWGNPSNSPVLVVHGYMDSAATFIPLVEKLSDDYYYVGFDMPGHGKSDPFPPGLPVSKILIVEIMRRVVDHMRWKQFVLLAHSMGCIIGIFYHNVFPGKIKKIIYLDPVPAISKYYYMNNKKPFLYKYFYNDYYKNFQKLSWEPRMKKIATAQIPEETLYTLMTTNMPPTLCIDASDSKEEAQAKQFAENLLHKCDETLPHFHRVTVNGGHDVHITHPELLVPPIENLLRTAFEKRSNIVKSKL